MNKTILLSLLVLIFATLACGLADNFENGRIMAILKETKFHNDEDKPPTFPIVIKSTFSEPKNVTITLDNLNPVQCLVQGKNAETVCPAIQLPNPGIHTIELVTSKTYGTQVKTVISVEWSPYTWLDNLAMKMPGVPSNDPGKGYIFGIAILVLIGMALCTTLGAILTNGNPQGLRDGAIAGFLLSMILTTIGVYNYASPGIAMGIVFWMVVIILAGFLLAGWMFFIKHGSLLQAPGGGTYLGSKDAVPRLTNQNQRSLPQYPNNRTITGSEAQILDALSRTSDPDVQNRLLDLLEEKHNQF